MLLDRLARDFLPLQAAAQENEPLLRLVRKDVSLVDRPRRRLLNKVNDTAAKARSVARDNRIRLLQLIRISTKIDSFFFSYRIEGCQCAWR